MLSRTFNRQVSDHSHLILSNETETVGRLISDKIDRVHPVPDCSEGFVDSRVGMIGESHQTWVREFDGEITAALYTCSSAIPIRDERDLLGNVGNILSSPVKTLVSDPTMIIFYSISAFKNDMDRGSGRNLINDVYNSFSGQDIWLSTLSPMRTPDGKGITRWIEEEYGAKFVSECRDDDNLLKDTVFEYLYTFQDPVQKFHMGNGAYIGDVNLRANTQESADYRDGMNVMINYVYPCSKIRSENQRIFKKRELPISAHLEEDMSARNKGRSRGHVVWPKIS